MAANRSWTNLLYLIRYLSNKHIFSVGAVVLGIVHKALTFAYFSKGKKHYFEKTTLFSFKRVKKDMFLLYQYLNQEKVKNSKCI